MIKLILTVKHRTIGEAGTEFAVPSENVDAWIQSGKAKLPESDKPIKAKKKDSKK
jgi:hypothetical protein